LNDRTRRTSEENAENAYLHNRERVRLGHARVRAKDALRTCVNAAKACQLMVGNVGGRQTVTFNRGGVWTALSAPPTGKKRRQRQKEGTSWSDQLRGPISL
jgi:hypothetical protein